MRPMDHPPLSDRDGMRAVGIAGRGGRAASLRIEARGAGGRLGRRVVRLPTAIAVAHRDSGRACGRLGWRVVRLPTAIAVGHRDATYGRLGWRVVRLPTAIAVTHRDAGRACGRL